MSNYKSRQMSLVNKVIINIETMIASQSNYTPYFYININGFIYDTRFTNSDMYGLISFTNKKNGSGKANMFEIVLAYSPQLDKDLDISRIDRALLDTNISDRRCKIRYGYSYSNNDLSSPLFEGRILKYTTEMRDNILLYTIEGYSSVSSQIEIIRSFPGSPNMATNPLIYIKDILEQTFGNEYTVAYDLSIGDENTVDDIEIDSSGDVNVFEYVRDMLKLVRNSEYDDDSVDKPVYDYYISDVIDDSTKKKTIYLTNYSLKYNKDDQKGLIIFDWGNNKQSVNGYISDFVMSFQTRYNGQIALARNILSSREFERYGISQDGKIVKVDLANSIPSTIRPGIMSEIDESNIGKDLNQTNLEISTWIQAMQYTYTADMVTLGIPVDIPIGGYIKIVPTIAGKEHHSSGIYMVTSSEDIIDNNGFETHLSLVKMNDTIEDVNDKSTKSAESKIDYSIYSIGPRRYPAMSDSGTYVIDGDKITSIN